MSVDIFYDFIFKGESEELARLVDEQFDERWFYPQSLGIDYPESFSYWNSHDRDEIINDEITELNVRILVVKRMHFTNQSIEYDIYDEFKRQYPDLEIERIYVGD
ncbi:MAG: hypothetical protein Q4P11_04990 [Methanobrevibacter sp.]|nr:hypothetical protein [Methanobrevibacter sp.]